MGGVEEGKVASRGHQTALGLRKWDSNLSQGARGGLPPCARVASKVWKCDEATYQVL